METAFVYMILTWNNPFQESIGINRLAVISMDAHYRTEEACWTAVKAMISSVPDKHYACVKTMVSKSEFTRLESIQARVRATVERLNKAEN